MCDRDFSVGQSDRFFGITRLRTIISYSQCAKPNLKRTTHANSIVAYMVLKHFVVSDTVQMYIICSASTHFVYKIPVIRLSQLNIDYIYTSAARVQVTLEVKRKEREK